MPTGRPAPSVVCREQATKEARMDTYVILRRSGWRTGADLEEAAARSTAEGERTPDDIR